MSIIKRRTVAPSEVAQKRTVHRPESYGDKEERESGNDADAGGGRDVQGRKRHLFSES